MELKIPNLITGMKWDGNKNGSEWGSKYSSRTLLANMLATCYEEVGDFFVTIAAGGLMR